jgi:hypothetical protein
MLSNIAVKEEGCSCTIKILPEDVRLSMMFD